MARAERLGVRPATADELLDWLRSHPGRVEALCHALTEESPRDVRYLEEAVQAARGDGRPHLMSEVAERALLGAAADAARLALAADLLAAAAEAWAMQGGEHAYDCAASAWARLGAILPRAECSARLREFRERHRRRRNLRAALDRAGLAG